MDGKVINIDPDILGGTPVFFGTRVPIKNLFDYLETGDSIEVFLEDFDGVSKEQVVKVLEMSQKLISKSSLFIKKQNEYNDHRSLGWNRIRSCKKRIR